MEQRFEVLIDADGKLHLRTMGFAGPKCIEERKKLVTMLTQAGIEMSEEDVQLTGEYYAREQSGVKSGRG